MSLNEAGQRRPSTDTSPPISHEPARHMVSEIDAAYLPNELVDIGVSGQIPFRNRIRHDFDQHRSPLRFEFADMVPNSSVQIIQFEQRG